MASLKFWPPTILVVLVAALTTGCGQQVEPNTSASAPDPGVQLSTCKEVIATGWVPPVEGNPQVDWDPKTGNASFSFSENDELRLNIRTDPDCPRVPILGKMITQMLTSAQQDLIAECANAVALVLKGEPPRHGDVVGDLDGLRRGITTECPPRFDEQLKAVGK